jgi:transposase
MNKRMFPVKKKWFEDNVKPLMDMQKDPRGRKPLVSDYHVFCAFLYILRTGIAWRDLPHEFGYWHTVYLRFKRGADRGVWWSILMILQHKKCIRILISILDSTTIQVHRHGSGGLEVVAKA